MDPERQAERFKIYQRVVVIEMIGGGTKQHVEKVSQFLDTNCPDSVESFHRSSPIKIRMHSVKEADDFIPLFEANPPIEYASIYKQSLQNDLEVIT